MNQIAILPAGCLISSKDTLFSNEQFILYSSNLAVYILNAQTFIVEKIIAVAEQTIASIVVSPHDNNFLIATGCDGFLSLWMLKEEQLICRVNVQASTGFLLAWDPFSHDHCAVLMNQPTMRLLYWDVRKAVGGLSELFVMKNQNVQVVSIKWNLLTQGLLAAGCTNGTVILFQVSTKTQKFLSVPDRAVAVVDIQWDRLSSVYLLVAYQSFISLWDTESLTEIHTFDKQGNGITAIAWMDWTVGNFVSTHCKNGYLKVWNASQRQPLESIRVVTGGLVTVYFGIGTKRAICACLDGSVVVYHMVKMQIEHCTAAGHTETIFDGTFSPASPDILATASYDGTIKLWNVSDLSLTKTLRSSSIVTLHPHTRCLRSVHRVKSIVYCCDWSPKGNMLAGCTSQGFVVIWDIQSGTEVGRYQHHLKAVYCVAWNKGDESLVASVSGDCSLIIMELDLDARKSQFGMLSPKSSGKGTHKMSGANFECAESPSVIKLKYVHPASVFGCAWSHHVSTLLTTCCMDGLVRVFDCALHGKAAILYILRGHSARAFVAVWSPLLPGTIASGSDDNLVLIWKINLANIENEQASEEVVTPCKELRGHSKFIRALAWSHEMEGLILSGSWDCSIRLWNIASGECLHVIRDHSADVYSIASHPNRPFTFMSCSRDTTVRLWELGGAFDRMRIQAVYDCGLSKLIGKESDTMGIRSSGIFDGKDPITEEDDLAEGIDGCTISSSRGSPLLQLKALLLGKGSRILNRELVRLDATSATPPPSISSDDGRSKSTKDMRSRSMVSERLFLAQRFHKIFGFFCGANGSLDVIDGVLTLLALQVSAEKYANKEEWHEEGEKCSSLTAADVAAVMAVVRGPQHRLILHESEILAKARNEARLSESARMSSKSRDISGKAEEQLRKAALHHARLGDFSKYCAMMVDLGEWTAALALAPCVSHEYWKDLADKYARHLLSASLEQCVPYLVAVGADTEAVDFYLQRRDTGTALVLAKMSEGRLDTPSERYTGIIPDVERREGGFLQSEVDKNGVHFSQAGGPCSITSQSAEMKRKDVVEVCCHDKLNMAESLAKRDLVLAVNNRAATNYIASSRPIHAAAQMLAVGDAASAVRILSACGEDDLAYAVSICMGLDTDFHLISMADKMAAYDALPEAMELLNGINGLGQRWLQKANQLGILELDYGKHSDREPRQPSDWILKALEEVAIGCDSEATIAFVIGRKYTEAAALAITSLRKLMRVPLDLSHAEKRMLRSIKYLRVTELDTDLRVQFLCYLFWFTAHEAIEMGLWETGWCILRVIRNGMKRKLGFAENHFPISSTEIKYQELVFKLVAGDQSALLLLDEILSNITQDIPRQVSTLNPSSSNIVSRRCSDNVHSNNSSNFDKMNGEGGEEHGINSSSLAFKGTEESKGSMSRLSGVASVALRNLGRLSVSMATTHPIGIAENIVTDDNLADVGSAPSSRFSCNSVSGSNSSGSKYACGEDATFDENFVPPPPEVAEILKNLRSLLVDASNTRATKSSVSSSSIRPISSQNISQSRRASFQANSTDLGDKSQEIEGLWGPSAKEIQRLTQRISEIYSLPSMDRFMHPSLKGYSSARAMSERASSRAEARSVSRVSSSIAMGIDKGRALVKNPAVPVDIIAKGSLLPVANLHMRVLKSCITEITIQGAVVDLNYIGRATSMKDKKMGVSDCAETLNQPQLLAGLNEALAWRKVLPFLPNMSGELISYI